MTGPVSDLEDVEQSIRDDLERIDRIHDATMDVLKKCSQCLTESIKELLENEQRA